MSITRVEAARHIVELLREKGYFALTHAPLQGRSIVRIDVRKAHGDEASKVASIWVLLDGRIRVESHPSPFGEESARAVERLVRQALSAFEIQPTAPEEGTKTDALELYQGSSGAWVVGDQHFVQRSDAGRYFSSVHEQHTKRLLDVDRDTRAGVPRTTSDNEPVSFDFDAARVFFRDGQPGVILPFLMGNGESQRRGQLRAAERFDRREPGHVAYALLFDAHNDEQLGSFFDENDVPEWIRATMRPLLRIIPPYNQFDGALVDWSREGITISFQQEPSDYTRTLLRRVKFHKLKEPWLTWIRARSEEAIWWARHIAYTVQRDNQNAESRRDAQAPSSAIPRSNDSLATGNKLARGWGHLHTVEDDTAHRTLKLLKTGDEEAIQQAVDTLLRARDHVIELTRVFHEDGSKRSTEEPAESRRDVRAPLPEEPTRVAQGIELWEHDGTIIVKLAAEPSEWLREWLSKRGFVRSRKRGDVGIWRQPSNPLGRYWAHHLAEREGQKDAEDSDLVSRRFAAPLPPEHQGLVKPPAPQGLRAKPPLVPFSPSLAEKLIRTITPGEPIASWEAKVRKAHDDTRLDATLALLRERFLTIRDGRIETNDWLDAFQRAWGQERHALVAMRVWGDSPVIKAAAALADERERAARKSEEREFADRIHKDELAALLPSNLLGGERARAVRVIEDALVALGLAERDDGDVLHARKTSAPVVWSLIDEGYMATPEPPARPSSGGALNVPEPEAAPAAPPSPRLAAIAAALKPQALSSARAPVSPREARSVPSAPIIEPPAPPPFIEVAAPAVAANAPAVRIWEDEGRVKVGFPSKPKLGSRESRVIEALKRARFTWWRPSSAWTKRATDEARAQAREAVLSSGIDLGSVVGLPAPLPSSKPSPSERPPSAHAPVFEEPEERMPEEEEPAHVEDEPAEEGLAQEGPTHEEDSTLAQQREAFQQRRERRVERLQAAGERRLADAATQFADARRMASVIPFGQPILVGHHSEGRDRRYRGKIDNKFSKSVQLEKEGQALLERAKAAQDNSAIFSDDPDAIAKLKEKVSKAEAEREEAKRINVAVRANNRQALAAMGLSEERIIKLFKPNFRGRIGVPGFYFTSKSAEIRRLQERIRVLEKQKARGPRAPEMYGDVKIDDEDNRIRIFLSKEQGRTNKALLMRHGFKFAPSVGAWQRHSTNDAWYYARLIAQQIGGPRIEPDAKEPG